MCFDARAMDRGWTDLTYDTQIYKAGYSFLTSHHRLNFRVYCPTALMSELFCRYTDEVRRWMHG